MKLFFIIVKHLFVKHFFQKSKPLKILAYPLINLFILSFVFFSSGSLHAYKYNLVICAIFQDEAPYLKEWIEFHKLVGVEHFYLYNNNSTDEYMDVLTPYIVNKEVDLIQWPFEPKNLEHWNSIQVAAYNNVLIATSFKAKWLALLDTDEFLFPEKEKSLVQFLEPYEYIEKLGGLCVNWQCYGTSHVAKVPASKLLIEMLLYKGPKDMEANTNVKSIVRPERVKNFPLPHIANYRTGYFQINPNNEIFEGPLAPYVVIDKIRINHYWARDEDFFFRIKIPRRARWGQSTQSCIEFEKGYNSEYDPAILRFVPKLKKALGL